MGLGRVVLITGCGGTLGRAYCRTLLESGYRVIATDILGARFSAICTEFSGYKEFYAVELDVTDETVIASVFDNIIAEGLAPNVVINNAAITGEFLLNEMNHFPDLSSTTREMWEKALNVNLTGAFLIAREMDRRLVGVVDTKLVNVSSVYGVRAPHHEIYEKMEFKSFAAYSASKAGIHGLTLWLASYWGKFGVTVNTLAPGGVNNNHSPDFVSKLSGLTILDRMAEADDIAMTMRFLVSDESRYLTGQLISCDGGFSAW